MADLQIFGSKTHRWIHYEFFLAYSFVKYLIPFHILQSLDFLTGQTCNSTNLVGVVATLLHMGSCLCEALVGGRLNDDHFVLRPFVPVGFFQIAGHLLAKGLNLPTTP